MSGDDVVYVTKKAGSFQADEDAVIRKHWMSTTSHDIGLMIQRDASAVRVRARRLGLPSKQCKTPQSKREDGARRSRVVAASTKVAREAKSRVVLVVDPAASKLAQLEQRQNELRARWRIESLSAECSRLAAIQHTKCVCGKPGRPFCEAHTAILVKHGVA